MRNNLDTEGVSTDEKKIDELLTRAVENVIPKELAKKKLLSGEKLRIYFGVDPTGPKLHLGHAVPLRKMREFSELGHHVIFLVGSFTAMIGDPTGKDAAREPLTSDVVQENFKDYKRQAEKILDFSKVEIRYNDEWLAPLKFGEIVKLASNFTVQQMMQRDMFQKRLEEGKPISLHEFLYPLMVGYDSIVLDVDCELGGSDQEFNMLAGRHLQSSMGKRDKFVLTTKLIEGNDGRKMSKTYNNCIYLEDEPHDMFGKVMATKDELVSTYFEVCTGVSKPEIQEILKGHPKEAKMRLGREIVTLYYGEEIAKKAGENFDSTFSEGGVPEDVEEVRVALGTTVQDALATLGESNSELRRLIMNGAVKEVGGESQVFTNPKEPVARSLVLRIGKHRFLKIVME